MITRPFGTDVLEGTQTLYHEDPVDGSVTIETFSDVDCVIEQTKANYNNVRGRKSPWKGDFHHVASIPIVVAMQLEKDGIMADPKAYARWLNARENRVFRSRPGII